MSVLVKVAAIFSHAALGLPQTEYVASVGVIHFFLYHVTWLIAWHPSPEAT